MAEDKEMSVTELGAGAITWEATISALLRKVFSFSGFRTG